MSSNELSANSVGRVYEVISDDRPCYISVLLSAENLKVLYHRRLGVGAGWIDGGRLPICEGGKVVIADLRGWYEVADVGQLTDITERLDEFTLCWLGVPGVCIDSDSVGRIYELRKGQYTKSDVDYVRVEGFNQYDAMVVSSHCGLGAISTGHFYPKYLPIREGEPFAGYGYAGNPERQNAMSGPSGLLWRITDITDNLEDYPLCKLTREG